MSAEADTRSRSESPKRQARLVLTAFFEEKTLVFELRDREAVVFGRGEGCEVRIDHPSVSRKHARFHLGHPVTVEDLQSRNGTAVRGTPLAPRQQAPVRPGDVIECGDVLLLLQALPLEGPASKLEAEEAATAALSRRITELVIGPGGRWFQPVGGTRINLGRRGPLRRVLLTLAKHRLDHPGDGLDVQRLIAAGWPGEKILYKAGLARAYTTVQRLRALGLQDALLTGDEGYLLHPSLFVRIEEG
jgi:pSer/pThr/pTyr-binding forkhead associated (FHA) protein